jgi:hypothetical protein
MHKFKIGQTVQLIPTLQHRDSAGRDYKILRLLPETAGEFSYRIRSQSEPHERVVKETALRKWPGL